MSAGSSGTVTFLFTDIEGSTRKWEEQPELMRAALMLHDGLVRDAVESHGGRVVKSTGDGVFASFARTQNGASSAVAAQVALAEAVWPDGLGLRVRMGLHVGTATERDGDYFGPDVNRAARVMSVAHGGQIVCTAAVAEFVRESCSLVDLGEHHLRDLQSSVHLFQVDAPGLHSEFPPVRSLDAYRSNLPYELSSFVGRDDELRTVAELMRGSRVVSIVGVGGVGKTRLAVQAGSELLPHYPDGVWLCELASVLDADDLPDAVAAAVGYTPPQGVSVADGLPRYFERKDLLLLLDNCEHLVSAVAAFTTSITGFAPRVSVLATSREALGVRGEHISPLSSLGVPDRADAASVLASEAGALFVARAGEARGELVMDDANATAVRDLCERLDGIPLAIELAAAQTAMMSPAEILTRLEKQFRLLTGGRRVALERHQTLRAAIDWSYDLLGDDERALLDRLSVCVGGFDLDAAAAIAAGIGVDDFAAFELLGSLVAKSLVERNERDGRTRYRLLEMIRQYAAEHLNTTGGSERARDDHARHYLAVAITLVGEATTAEDYDALERLETDTANVAASGQWLLGNDRVAELMDFFHLLPFIDRFAFPPATLDELGKIAGEAAARPDASTLAGFSNACFVANGRAYLNGELGDFRYWAELAQRSAAGEQLAVTLIANSSAAIFDGDLALAASLARRAAERARQHNDHHELAFALSLLTICEATNNPEAALPAAQEALAAARRAGGVVTRIYPLVAVATAAVHVDPRRALEAADECVRIDRTRRRFWSSVAHGIAARICVDRGEVTDGLIRFREILRSCENNGERVIFSMQLAGVAAAIARTEPATAIELAAIAESDASAPVAAFTNLPELVRLADELPTAISAARVQATAMSYDDAIDFVFAAIDRLIEEDRTPTPPPTS